MQRKSYFSNLFLFFITAVMLLSCDGRHQTKESVDYSESIVRSLLSKTEDLTMDVVETGDFVKTLTNPFSRDSSAFVAYYSILGNISAKQLDLLNPRSESYYQKAIKLAESEDLPVMKIWSLVNYGYYFYTFRQPDEALPLFMEAAFLIEKLGEDKVILPEDTFRKLGFFFGTLGNHEDAISYLKKGDQYATILTQRQRAMLLDNLGLYHLYSQDTTAALNYFLQAESLASSAKDQVRYGKVLGNIALVHMGRGMYPEALALINRDLFYSIANKSDQNTMYARILKAKILLKMDSISSASVMLDRAEEYANAKIYLKKDILEIERLKLEIALIKGDERGELLIRRKLEVLEEVVAGLDGELNLLQNKWQVDKEKNQKALVEAESNYQSERFKFFMFATAVLFVGLGLFVFLSHIRRQSRARVLTYEKKVVELQLKKITSDKNLLVANETLASYKEYLTEKNRQIDDLQQAIRGITDSGSHYLEKEKRLLQELLDSHLLTEESWASFRRSFDANYPNFYLNLRHEFPELTESNMRYLVLSKLGLSITEISNLLGISTESVKKSRQRLKKKIGDRFKEFEQALYS